VRLPASRAETVAVKDFGKNFFCYSGEKLFVVSSGKAKAYNLARP
jgi:hypothetical protein